MPRILLLLVLSSFSWLCTPLLADEPEPAAGKVQLTLDTEGHHGVIVKMFFTPKTERLITVGDDQTVQVWDVKTGKREKRFWLPAASGLLRSAALSADGKTLAVAAGVRLAGSAKGNTLNPLWLINLEDGSLRSLDKRPKGGGVVGAMAFSPKGDRLAYGRGTDIFVWDLKANQKIVVFRAVTGARGILDVHFSPAGDRLLSLTGKSAQVFEIPPRPMKGPPVEEALLLGKGWHNTGGWTGDGKVLLGRNGDGIHLYSASGELLKSHTLDKKADKKPGLEAVRLVQALNGKQAFVVWRSPKETTGLILDLEDGGSRPVLTGAEIAAPLIEAALSPDGRIAAVTDVPQYQIVLWSVAEGKKLRRLGESARPPALVGWSPDGKAIAWGPRLEKKEDRVKALARGFVPGELKVLGRDELKGFVPGRQTANGWTFRYAEGATEFFHAEKKKSAPFPGGIVSAWTVFPDGKGGTGGVVGFLHPTASVVLFQADTGKQLATFGWHRDVHDVAVSPLIGDDPKAPRFLLIARGSPETWLYRLDQPERPLLKFFFTDTDWVVWTEEGYYAASPGGERLIGWRVDNGQDQFASFYPVERFRKKLYRPDIIKLVLEKGSVAEAMKAVDAKPLDLEALLPPKISLEVVETKLPQVTVRVSAKAQAKGQPVTALRLFLDGRALDGDKGYVEFKTGRDEFQGEWTITLPGEKQNAPYRLTMLARSHDVSAFSNAIEVPYINPAKLPTMYVLAVGIDRYREKTLRLDCAVADAKAIAANFQKCCKGELFKDVVVKTLLDDQANRKTILKELELLHKSVQHDDVVVVFFAGHGVKNKDRYFLLTGESDTTDAKTLAKSALSGNELRKALTFKCQVLVLLDACYSGAFGDKKKGLKGALAPQGYRPATDDAIRELSAEDVGAVVLCAAMADQKAQERDGHGLFTRAIVQALNHAEGVPFNRRDRMLYVHHLYAYVFDEVKEASGDEQHPSWNRPSIVTPFPVVRFAKTGSPGGGQ